jgi:hypothetical protein
MNVTTIGLDVAKNVFQIHGATKAHTISADQGCFSFSQSEEIEAARIPSK